MDQKRGSGESSGQRYGDLGVEEGVVGRRNSERGRGGKGGREEGGREERNKEDDDEKGGEEATNLDLPPHDVLDVRRAVLVQLYVVPRSLFYSSSAASEVDRMGRRRWFKRMWGCDLEGGGQGQGRGGGGSMSAIRGSFGGWGEQRRERGRPEGDDAGEVHGRGWNRGAYGDV